MPRQFGDFLEVHWLSFSSEIEIGMNYKIVSSVLLTVQLVFCLLYRRTFFFASCFRLKKVYLDGCFLNC